MIYEDEDDIGYSKYPNSPKWSDYYKYADALVVCNLLLPKPDRDLIVQAAIHEHEKRPKLAALTRKRAGYC